MQWTLFTQRANSTAKKGQLDCTRLYKWIHVICLKKQGINKSCILPGMRLRTCLLIAVSVLLVIGIDGARDRKKSKNRHRDSENTAEDTEEGHGRSGSFFGEQEQDDRRKEKQEKVKERLMEKKEREKEEESSEEKDDKDKDKEKNSTAGAEIEIPKRLRRTFQLTRARELNDGEQRPLNNRIIYSNSKQHRVRRWPKKDHVNMRKKVKSAKKTIKHKPLRLRRARKYDSMENVDPYVRTRFRKSSRALDSTEFF
ncbi:unnamed protein product [Cylicocyclus nassatus]|uniref:Uncharacterized protein n=1 Tax=Cylicocyclus nassatus TaxID=53992 RepID=A0AA36MFA3_CYLNA|nr:unnamed protein product [Cylicocyclus nassatus]